MDVFRGTEARSSSAELQPLPPGVDELFRMIVADIVVMLQYVRREGIAIPEPSLAKIDLLLRELSSDTEAPQDRSPWSNLEEVPAEPDPEKTPSAASESSTPPETRSE